MNQLNLIDHLGKLNFTKLEAQIYLALLESGAQSGYHLAKKIDISRSSIYNALDHMYEKGIIMLLPDSTATYVAENPDTLFKRLNYEYEMNSKLVTDSLTNLFQSQHEERVTNLKGFESIIFKTKELLATAESEIYINTNFDLNYFKEEFTSLRQKGVRIIVFSFYQIDCTIDAEIYTHDRPLNRQSTPSRLMIVVDGKITLVADSNDERGTWLGTITNNPLMISIITEHIHNDIYLLKLRRKYGFIFDDNTKLDTNFEKKWN